MHLSNSLRLKTRVSSGFSITDVDDLLVWLQNNTGITLNGSNVSAWADSSGNNNVARQTTETNQPLADGGGIDLDGTDNFMTLDTALNLNGFTIFAVIDLDDTTLETLLGNGTNGDDFFRLNGSAWTLRTEGSSFQGNMATTAGTAKYLLTLTTEVGGSATRYKLEANGTQESAIILDNQTFTVKDIGRNSANAQFFNGKLYELAIYGDELSAANRELVEANIMSRNGL
tara:strand:+ start:889 stop:1575 length:687 start_codon:yes stop_codon:yes gene_type:complete